MPRTTVRLVPLLTLIALVFGGWGSVHAQSAWTQPEGSTYLQVSLQQIGGYDRLFRGGDDFRTGREISETSVETYIEHGLREGSTLVGVLPVRFLRSGSLQPGASIQPTTIERGTETELGNIQLGLRQRIAKGSVDAAVQLTVEAPTGDFDRSTGLRSGIGAFTFTPTISVGRVLGRAYVQGYTGFALRTNGYSHDWRGGVEAGYRVHPKVLIAGTVDIVEAFTNGSIDDDPTNLETGLYVNEQEYVSYGIKGLVELGPGFGVQGAVRSAISGRNVPKAPFVSVGMYFSW